MSCSSQNKKISNARYLQNAHLKDYFNLYLYMNLLEFKNTILEVKLSNEFKKVNESFLKLERDKNF
jgi:hypothetical protein